MINIDRQFLEKLKSKYNRFNELLTYEEVLLDKKLFLNLEKQKQSMENVVNKYLELIKREQTLSELDGIINNSEGEEKELFLNEKDNALLNLQSLEKELVKAINSYSAVMQSCMVEFVADKDTKSTEFVEYLRKAYINYCKNNGFECEVVNDNILLVAGLNAKNIFNDVKGNHLAKFDTGESQVQIFVFDKVEIIAYDEKDVTLTACRSSGAGGQHVNTTDSAIKATHNPTGISCICQDERSQFQNKEKALQNLRNKVENYYNEQITSSTRQEKRKQASEMKNNRYVRIYEMKEERIIKQNKDIVKLSEFTEGKEI